MKRLILTLLCSNSIANGAPLFNRLADAINRAENSKKYPYGIKSINVASAEEARIVCINTIRNNYLKWLKTNQKKPFIEFLGDVYCPPKIHSLNKNWVKNVKYFYTHN